MNDYWFAPIMIERIGKTIKSYDETKHSTRYLVSFSLNALDDLKTEEGYNPESPLLQDIIESINEIDEKNDDFIYHTMSQLLNLKGKLIQLISESDMIKKDSQTVDEAYAKYYEAERNYKKESQGLESLRDKYDATWGKLSEVRTKYCEAHHYSDKAFQWLEALRQKYSAAREKVNDLGEQEEANDG